MKLEKLILENFRQFRGRQEIQFSTIDERNVTVVHAENGFGKTALLNALLWGFYGHQGLTPDLPKKEAIIHEGTAARRANHGNGTAASVTIWFQHDGEQYCLKRELSLEQQRSNATRTDVTLEIYRDGMPFTERLAQPKIESIMPFGISQFLFFNGERIDHLAMEESAPLVTDAIRQMLGLKLLQTTIDDLKHPNVRGKLLAELRERTSEEKQGKIDEQTETDEQIGKLVDKKKTTQDNATATDSELLLVNTKLESNRVAHQLQIRRVQLEKQRDELGERLSSINKRLGRLVAEDGYALLADDLVKRGTDIIETLRSENKIPARVLNIFLQELLTKSQCICTRHLQEGSPERKAIENLMTYAGDMQFNNAVSALENALGRIQEARIHVLQTLQELNRDRLRGQDDRRVLNEEIEKIRQELGGKADEEVHKLEETREKLLLRQRELIAEQARIETKIDELRKLSDKLRDEIKDIEESEEDAQRAQRRLNAVEEASRVLQGILDVETAELRPLLNKEIDEHFRRIMDRAYWAELTEDFRLRILHDVPLDGETTEESEVALSTGQRQITSLVFIASLVALASRRSEIPSIVRGLTGSHYPMVMDSPFGQLSTRFRSGVAKWIPSLAPQVIIFVSHTQHDGPVADELKKSKRVGKRYYLTYHSPKPPKDAEIELKLGKASVCVYFENREEFTEIRELES